MGLLSKIVSIPFFGKRILENLKKKAFEPFQIPFEKSLEKQRGMLYAKFNRMEGTEIGRKLGVRKRVNLQNLPITDYSVYEPFYSNPSPGAFMYPLNEYVRIKTSGSSGKEKWFLLPRRFLLNSFRETAIPMILAAFHDEEKITLQYGDSLYLNLGPAPYAAGTTASLGSMAGKTPFVKFVPNLNLPYKDKVRYFILNHKSIDGAIMPAATLISQIMPAIKKPIRLKGLLVPDTPEVDAYKEKIEDFTGTTPKTAYCSTETIVSSVPSVQYPMGFFFDLRRGIFELISMESKKAGKEEIVNINDVNIGEVYQLIYTCFESELTRIDTKASFKCIAKGDDILGTDYPIFKYHARLDKLISLQNFTRIDEDELLNAFKEGGVPFVGLTARVESEKGLEYLSLYIEPKEKMRADDIKETIHNQLYEMDGDYRDLADSFEYIPVKVHLAPTGVFAEFLEGKTGSFAKVTVIEMREEEFHRLRQIIDRRVKLE